MQDITQQHSARSWWMRPLVRFIGAAVVLLFVFVMFEMTDGPAATSYGAFLDQLDAGNVASVTFQGTQIGSLCEAAAGRQSTITREQ